MEVILFIAAILTSVLGFGFVNYIFIPLRKYKDTVSLINKRLIYYSHIITSPGDAGLANEAQPKIRDLATELEAYYLAVPAKTVLKLMRLLPPRKYVLNAKGSLIFISNSVHQEGYTDKNCEALEMVYTSLNIPELEGRWNQKYQKAIELRKSRMGNRYQSVKLN